MSLSKHLSRAVEVLCSFYNKHYHSAFELQHCSETVFFTRISVMDKRRVSVLSETNTILFSNVESLAIRFL
jgi:hypothetical protein